MPNALDTPSSVFLSKLNAVCVADNYEAIRGQETRKSHGFQRAVDFRVGVGWVEGYYIILSLTFRQAQGLHFWWKGSAKRAFCERVRAQRAEWYQDYPE